MLVKKSNKSRANYTEHEHALYYANRECKHQPISGAAIQVYCTEKFVKSA